MKNFLFMGIGLIIGSIGTMCSIHYIEQYKFEKHIEVMKNSPDAESVSKSVLSTICCVIVVAVVAVVAALKVF